VTGRVTPAIGYRESHLTRSSQTKINHSPQTVTIKGVIMLATIIVLVLIVFAVTHLAGGARSHRRHYQQHGAHPRLMYTYGRGWYGSVRLPGNFRLGHRL